MARPIPDVPSDSEFPLQNLPYGVFTRPDEETPRVGTRLGDTVVDLKVLEHAGLFRDTPLGETHVFCKRSLNKFMQTGRTCWDAARARLTALLDGSDARLADDADLRKAALVDCDRVTMQMPVEIGDYTDFYSSKHHAFNVGTMFRGPQNALMPNYTWIPVGYHGRASSVVPSGTPVRRPCGQTRADEAEAPTFGPCRLLDFELEMGFFTGPGNPLGAPLTMDNAADQIFGMVLVNDWSARDIQKWEYVPLGPFLAKNFATTISHWVVPMAALAPFRCAAPEPDHPPLDYLRQSDPPEGCGPGGWAYDIELEVSLQTAEDDPFVISRSNFRHLYWTMQQQLTHHTSSGCNMRAGDLLASGTISGPTPESFGSMLELAWRGTKPIRLPSGAERKFLQDGDTLVMRGWCQGDGYRIGFGECRGTVLAALDA